jgi:predicted glutamine amidotransferase
MCRLLMVKNNNEFSVVDHLEIFAGICKKSREYQGHGWGMVYLKGGKKEIYRTVTPIWEDDLTRFGETSFMMVHARSAFRDKGIDVENNMPFIDQDFAFVFNGELRGVKIKVDGRIGAEKIFNVIRRFNASNQKKADIKDSMLAALERAVSFIGKRTTHIRAMNMIITDMNKVYLCSLFNSEPEYFSMYKKQQKGGLIICSAPYPNESKWIAIENKTTKVFR